MYINMNIFRRIRYILILSIVICISWNRSAVCAKEAELSKEEYIERVGKFEKLANMFRAYDNMVWDNGSRLTPSERAKIKTILDDRLEKANAYVTWKKVDVIYTVISELFEYDEEFDPRKVNTYGMFCPSPNLLLNGVPDEKITANTDIICHMMQCYLVSSGIDALKISDKRDEAEYNIIAYYAKEEETWIYVDPAAALKEGKEELGFTDYSSSYSRFNKYFQPACVSFGYDDKVCNTRSIYFDKSSYLESRNNHSGYDYPLIYDSDSQKVIMTDYYGNPLPNHSYYGSVEKTGDNGEVTTGWLSCTSFYSGDQNLLHKAFYQFGTPVQGYITIDGKEYNFTYGGAARYHRACYMAEDFLVWEILEPVDKPKDEADAYAKWRLDKLANLEKVVEGMRKAGYRYQLDYSEEELEYLKNAAAEATDFSYVKAKAEIYQPLISIVGMDIGIPKTKDDVTEVQKAIAILAYIREHLTYVGGSVSYDGYVALTSGYATCAQYSELFSVLCELSGIRTVKIIGTLGNRHAVYGDNYSDHAFNAAYLDGTWYYTDPTNIINLFTMDIYRGLIPLGLVNESQNASFHMVYLSKDDLMREEAHYRKGYNWVYDFDESGNLGVYLYNSNGEVVVNDRNDYFHTDSSGKRESMMGFVNYEKSLVNDNGEIEKWEVKTYLQCGLPVYGNYNVDGTDYKFNRQKDIGNGIPYTRDHRISVSPLWKLNLKNGIGPYEYTGEEICPKPIITYTVNGVEKGLTEGVDYELSYDNNIKVNSNSNIKSAIYVTGLGEYDYAAVIYFTINPYKIKEEDVVWPEQRDFTWSIDYDKDGGIPSVEPSFSNPLLVGSASIEYGPVTFMDDSRTKIYSINGTVTVKGTGNCTGEVSRDFTTSKVPITDENSFRISLDKNEFLYDNTDKKPEVIVEWLDEDGKVYRKLEGGDETEAALNKDKEFVVTYADNKNAGESTVTVKGLRNFEGSLERTFTIDQADISDNEETVDIFKNAAPNLSSYTGLPVEPLFNGVQQSDQTTGRRIYLTENTDYTIEYSNNIHAGEAKAVMKGIGNYTGEIERTFTISPKLLNSSNISVSARETSYNGEIQMPVVTVDDLIEGEDYRVTCKKYDSATDSYVDEKPVEAGRYLIDVVLINTDYELTGDCSVVYTITSSGSSGEESQNTCVKHQVSFVAATVPDCFNSGSKAHYVCNVCKKLFYDLEAANEVTNKLDLVISPDTDNGHDWGDWEVVRAADAENEGLKKRVCKNLSSHVEYAVIPKKPDTSGSGINNNPGNSSNTDDKGSDSTSGSDTDSGNPQITYSQAEIANLSKTKVKILSLKNNKKKLITVKWKKVSNVSGYQVSYAINKKFTKNKSIKNVRGTVLKIKGLKKRKKYYVRVRAYIDSDNKIVYSKWSTLKKIKIKK